MIKLKTCPFCNGHPRLYKEYTPELSPLLKDKISYVFFCNNCGMKTPKFSTFEELVVYWNTRKAVKTSE